MYMMKNWYYSKNKQDIMGDYQPFRIQSLNENDEDMLPFIPSSNRFEEFNESPQLITIPNDFNNEEMEQHNLIQEQYEIESGQGTQIQPHLINDISGFNPENLMNEDNDIRNIQTGAIGSNNIHQMASVWCKYQKYKLRYGGWYRNYILINGRPESLGFRWYFYWTHDWGASHKINLSFQIWDPDKKSFQDINRYVPIRKSWNLYQYRNFPITIAPLDWGSSRRINTTRLKWQLTYNFYYWAIFKWYNQKTVTLTGTIQFD